MIGYFSANQRSASFSAMTADKCIYLRLELFELGILQLPTHSTHINGLDKVARCFSLEFECHSHTSFDDEYDIDMQVDTTQEQTTTQQNKSMTEYPWRPISYATWESQSREHILWRPDEHKAFWMLLVYFHQNSLQEESISTVMDEDYCLNSVHVPLYKSLLFLFVQTSRMQSAKSKTAPDSFDIRWCNDDFVRAAGGNENSLPSPSNGANSPFSPRTISKVLHQDRSNLQDHYISYVCDNMRTLLDMLFRVPYEGDYVTLQPEQIDSLQFLFGTTSHQPLSHLYYDWRDNKYAVAESANKPNDRIGFCNFLKECLCIHRPFYPNTKASQEAVTRYPDRSADPISREIPTLILNIAKWTVLSPPDTSTQYVSGNDLIIQGCHDAYIYILSCARNVMIIGCLNCTIVTAPNSGICFIDRCEKIRYTTASGLIRVNNCLDLTLNVFTVNPLLMTGENDCIILSPYNTKYPALKNQLACARLQTELPTCGRWDAFINLEKLQDQNITTEDFQNTAIQLQNPLHFREISIPTKASTAMTEYCLPLPKIYLDSIRRQTEEVAKLRNLVCSDEFDQATIRSMESFIQHRFKEWLVVTGNVRQILDLVQIEKAKARENTDKLPTLEEFMRVGSLCYSLLLNAYIRKKRRDVEVSSE